MSYKDQIEFEGFNFACNRSDLNILCRRLEYTNVMAEIGSLAGFSTRVFANYFDQVISVDPYTAGYDPADPNSVPERIAAAKKAFEIRFIDVAHVWQIKEPGAKACAQIVDEGLDFVYIDACHQFESVKEDIKCWLPKIRQGGYMAGHDYDRDGVKEAVLQYFKPEDIEIIRCNWLVRMECYNERVEA